MKCSQCGRRAIIIRHNKKSYCKEHFIKFVEKKFLHTVKKHKFFTKKDKIGVGVSGGKDSLTTVHLINKFLDNKITAIAIDEGIRGYRSKTLEAARKFCKEEKIPLKIYSFKDEFGRKLDNIVKKSINPCSVCGVLRRFLLNKKARELRCTKLATGHNLDDEVQSVLMNIFTNNIQRLYRLGAETEGGGKLFIPRVKPMRYLLEREVALYFLLKGFRTSPKECPYAKHSLRWIVMNNLYKLENKHRGTKHNILLSFDERIKPILEKKFKAKKILKNCEKCGEYTSSSICKTCEMVKLFCEK